MRTSKRTGLRRAEIPSVDQVKFPDPAANKAWEQLRTVIETRFGKSGQRLDKAVTWGDLVEEGLAKWRNSKGNIISGSPVDFLPVVPPVIDGMPPAPTGFKVTPGLAMVYLEWDKPEFDYFGKAEIWRATTNNQSQAVLVGQTTNWVYVDELGEAGVRYYYWVRFISVGGKIGPFNSVGGIRGEASVDPAYLIDVLSSDDPDALLWEVPSPTVIGGVPVNPGIYIRNAYIANGSISSAKIADAAITNAKVANLSAAKITFGEMDGDRIKTNTLDADRLIVNTLGARLAVITEEYVSSSNIADAAITNAKIANAAIESTKIKDAAITGAKIADAAITDAKIANATISFGKIKNDLQSDNYVKNVSGWKIDKNGNFEINGVGGGGRLTITNSLIRVYDSDNVMRVRMGIW